MLFRRHLRALAFAAVLLPAIPGFAHDGEHHPAAVTVGALQITGVFARATLPNAPVAGGFLTITNTGTTDDRLVSVAAAISGDVQLHEMAMENDVMKMRQLADGVPIPAGETVTLEPGGLHVMFMGLNTALVEGQTVPVTLRFEQAGQVTVEMAVAGAAADSADCLDHAAAEGSAH